MRGAPESRVGECARATTAELAEHAGEYAVVGTDEHTSATAHLDRHRVAQRAHARVDHAEHHALRHVGDGPGERQAARPDVERRDLVGEVDDQRVRRQVAQHRLHHADELVARAEVGEERHRVVSAAHRAHATERSRQRREWQR